MSTYINARFKILFYNLYLSLASRFDHFTDHLTRLLTAFNIALYDYAYIYVYHRYIER